MGMSALTVFEMAAGSMSTCKIIASGQNLLVSELVTRSSKRAPTASKTSQLCIAMLASYVPCIPSIPKKSLLEAGNAPKPIKVEVIGKLVNLEKFCNSMVALCPELIKPPPM